MIGCDLKNPELKAGMLQVAWSVWSRKPPDADRHNSGGITAGLQVFDRAVPRLRLLRRVFPSYTLENGLFCGCFGEGSPSGLHCLLLLLITAGQSDLKVSRCFETLKKKRCHWGQIISYTRTADWRVLSLHLFPKTFSLKSQYKNRIIKQACCGCSTCTPPEKLLYSLQVSVHFFTQSSTNSLENECNLFV